MSNQWLSGFAYRTTIGIGVFLLAGANYPADHDRYDQFPGLPDGDSESGKEPEE